MVAAVAGNTSILTATLGGGLPGMDPTQSGFWPTRSNLPSFQHAYCENNEVRIGAAGSPTCPPLLGGFPPIRAGSRPGSIVCGAQISPVDSKGATSIRNTDRKSTLAKRVRVPTASARPPNPIIRRPSARPLGAPLRAAERAPVPPPGPSPDAMLREPQVLRPLKIAVLRRAQADRLERAPAGSATNRRADHLGPWGDPRAPPPLSRSPSTRPFRQK